MLLVVYVLYFFFQAEDGIRDLVRSRGLGDVYKRQGLFHRYGARHLSRGIAFAVSNVVGDGVNADYVYICLLYTSDAADDLLCVDLGGRRIIKKKKQTT